MIIFKPKMSVDGFVLLSRKSAENVYTTSECSRTNKADGSAIKDSQFYMRLGSDNSHMCYFSDTSFLLSLSVVDFSHIASLHLEDIIYG